MHQRTWVYLGATVFCGVFSIVYLSYVPGVSLQDAYAMYLLFLVPLGIGFIPSLGLDVFRIHIAATTFAKIGLQMYHAGVATLTVMTALDGIYTIALVSSPFQTLFLYVSLLLLFVGILFVLIGYKDAK